MIPIPSHVVRGQVLTADLLRDVIEAIRRCRPIQGQGILLQETMQGTVIAAAAQTGQGGGTPFDHRFKVTARAEGDGDTPTYALHIRKGSLFIVEGELAAEKTLALEGLEQDPDDADAWRVANAAKGSLYIRKNKPTTGGNGSGSGNTGDNSGSGSGNSSGGGGLDIPDLPETPDITVPDLPETPGLTKTRNNPTPETDGTGDTGNSGDNSGGNASGSDTPQQGYTLAFGEPQDALFIIADFTPSESSANPYPKVTQRVLGDLYAFKGGSGGGLTVGPPELLSEGEETMLAWYAGTVAWDNTRRRYVFTRATTPEGAAAQPLFTLPLLAHRKDHAPGIPYTEQ